MQWLNYFFVIIVASIAFILIINVVELKVLKVRRVSSRMELILLILVALTFSFISSLLVNKMIFNRKFFYWFTLFLVSTLMIALLELKDHGFKGSFYK